MIIVDIEEIINSKRMGEFYKDLAKYVKNQPLMTDEEIAHFGENGSTEEELEYMVSIGKAFR